jgi:hypothetical protein
VGNGRHGGALLLRNASVGRYGEGGFRSAGPWTAQSPFRLRFAPGKYFPTPTPPSPVRNAAFKF